jgi:hypothetical protein
MGPSDHILSNEPLPHVQLGVTSTTLSSAGPNPAPTPSVVRSPFGHRSKQWGGREIPPSSHCWRHAWKCGSTVCAPFIALFLEQSNPPYLSVSYLSSPHAARRCTRLLPHPTTRPEANSSCRRRRRHGSSVGPISVTGNCRWIIINERRGDPLSLHTRAPPSELSSENLFRMDFGARRTRFVPFLRNLKRWVVVAATTKTGPTNQ